MPAHARADERAMLLAAASAVAGGGLLIWSVTSIARSRTRSGVSLLAGLGGAALLAHGVLGDRALALAGALVSGSRSAEAVEAVADDPVDIASMDSFPASDPPSTSGATAQVTRRGLNRAREARG